MRERDGAEEGEEESEEERKLGGVARVKLLMKRYIDNGAPVASKNVVCSRRSDATESWWSCSIAKPVGVATSR